MCGTGKRTKRRNLKPLIPGDRLAELLGLAPGRWVSDVIALEISFQLRQPLATAEECLAYLKENSVIGSLV